MAIVLRLRFAGASLPVRVTVTDGRRRVILREIVRSRSFAATVYPRSDMIIVRVEPLSTEQRFYPDIRFIRLKCLPECYVINLYFPFDRTEVPLPVQRFCLYDANYLLPVSQATLFFDSV